MYGDGVLFVSYLVTGTRTPLIVNPSCVIELYPLVSNHWCVINLYPPWNSNPWCVIELPPWLSIHAVCSSCTPLIVINPGLQYCAYIYMYVCMHVSMRVVYDMV